MTGLAAGVVCESVRCTVFPDTPRKLGHGFGPAGEWKTWNQFFNDFIATVNQSTTLKTKAIESKKAAEARNTTRLGRITPYITQWESYVLALYFALVLLVF